MPALVLAMVVALIATSITMSMLAGSPKTRPATSSDAQPTAPIAIAPQALAEDQAWALSDVAIDEPGQPSPLADGTIVRYVLQGAVHATSSTIVKEGSFQLIVSAFQPNHDMPGQRAGRWYIRGDWSITDAQAPPPARGQRHRRGVMAGTLVSELDANPFAATDAFTLPLHLPMTLTEAGWVLGKGTLTIHDARGDGSITLVVNRRATVVRPPSGEP
jgi:hypothetical protein